MSAYSKKEFDKIWNNVVLAEGNELERRLGITTAENAQEAAWDNYQYFRDHAKENYMNDRERILDRHKVTACLMYSIVKTDPFLVPQKELGDGKFWVVSEQIAISAGLSVLKGFIINADVLSNGTPKPKEQQIEDSKIFANGFLFPEANHGEYRNNFAVELYFTKKENSYNILSLSHSLFLLEMYNRERYKRENKTNI